MRILKMIVRFVTWLKALDEGTWPPERDPERHDPEAKARMLYDDDFQFLERK